MHQHNNIKKDQINFMHFIKLYINKFENENITIGDFNFYMDPELDKQKNMISNDNNPAFRQEMNALTLALTLEDAPGIPETVIST